MKSTDLIKGTLFTNIFLQIFNYILEFFDDSFGEMIAITFYLPTPQNGQAHSSSKPATASKFFECV